MALVAPLSAAWRVGDSACIGVAGASLHAQASGLSRRVAELPRYAVVSVTSVPKKAKAADDGSTVTARGWVGVTYGQQKGFVPANILIDAAQRKREGRQGGAGDDDASAAGRGFSEDESDADLKAMKGGLGDASFGASDSPQLAQWLAGEKQLPRDASADQEFRLDGRLGEFKPKATASSSTAAASTATSSSAKQE